MAKPFRIRAYEPDDTPTVIDLLQEVSIYRPSAHEIPRLAETFASVSDVYACVVIQGHRVIGFGSVFFLTRIRGGCSAIIEDVAVASDVRSQGIGREIINDLLRAARLRGCFKVTLESAESADSFYKSIGFESSGKVMKIFL